MKKWSGDISKLYLHTEFQENRPIRLVSSDAHRDTHIRTDIFCKPLFWTQGTSKRTIPQKSQHRIFLPSQYFLHTYCIWEKVKSVCSGTSKATYKGKSLLSTPVGLKIDVYTVFQLPRFFRWTF